MSVTVKTKYLGELRTENQHLQSGEVIITDAPVDNRGKGEAFSPTDLLATALGDCVMTIMGIKAMDNNIDIKGTELNITKIMNDSPRRVKEIIVEVNFPKKAYADKDKLLIERVASSCPVALSLHPDVKQSFIFNW
ncbi:OsmC family protein [Saccharicrinis aurantiacus]|uniref:OsmC family protein n=1 Tax=Saccharicrinis aurantiacus TaxID=1849719 RepID=UPI0008398EFC|nr:OsmC family protein [Saccharicrinis aurantiacus]